MVLRKPEVSHSAPKPQGRPTPPWAGPALCSLDGGSGEFESLGSPHPPHLLWFPSIRGTKRGSVVCDFQSPADVTERNKVQTHTHARTRTGTRAASGHTPHLRLPRHRPPAAPVARSPLSPTSPRPALTPRQPCDSSSDRTEPPSCLRGSTAPQSPGQHRAPGPREPRGHAPREGPHSGRLRVAPLPRKGPVRLQTGPRPPLVLRRGSFLRNTGPIPPGERGSCLLRDFLSQEATEAVLLPSVWRPPRPRAISSNHAVCRYQNRRARVF